VHGHFALSELGMLLYRGTRAAVCPCCLRSYDFIEASQTLTAATSEPRRGVSSRGQPDSRGGAAAATRAAAQPRDADAAHGRARLADAARGCSADAPPRRCAGRVARPRSLRGRADPRHPAACEVTCLPSSRSAGGLVFLCTAEDALSGTAEQRACQQSGCCVVRSGSCMSGAWRFCYACMRLDTVPARSA